MTHRIETQSEMEAAPESPLISELLPRYYEAHGEDPHHETIRSIMIDDHEVAWMEYTGTVKWDITGQGREGQEYSGRELYCACKFTEGIGWRVEDDGQVVNLMGPDKCLSKQAATYLRQLELRREYSERGMLENLAMPLEEETAAIMFDLMEKAKAGEFLGESGSGASFYGGYYYLQTVASIMNVPMGSMWDIAYRLANEKKISLDGAVVQPYREPNPPVWGEPEYTYELDGWMVSAALPTHDQMAQEWKFEVTKPDGEKLEIEIPGESLLHRPTFGPDASDIARAQERMAAIVAQVRQEHGE